MIKKKNPAHIHIYLYLCLTCNKKKPITSIELEVNSETKFDGRTETEKFDGRTEKEKSDGRTGDNEI